MTASPTPMTDSIARRLACAAGRALLVAASCAATTGYAQDSYELIVVPPIEDGDTSESSFFSINNQGIVLGCTTFKEQQPNGNFRITNECFKWIVADGWLLDERRNLDALNDVGDAAQGGDTGRAFFTSGDEFFIPTLSGDVSVSVNAMNDAGMVVGHSRRQGSISQGIPREAFYWTPQTGTVSFRDAVPLAGATRDVNNAGQMVGISGNGLFANNQAFYYDSTTNQGIDLHSLLVTPGFSGVRSEANAINEAGQVVGMRRTGFGGDQRAFLWSADQGVTLLPLPMTEARDINDHGVVVGQRFRYTPDGTLADLNSLADTNGFEIAIAQSISNSGIIVGWGRRPGNPLATAFVLVPIPGSCLADLTGPDGLGDPDGVLDADDFFFYLDLFSSGDPAADLTGGPDGIIDANDFFEYLSLFAAGCP